MICFDICKYSLHATAFFKSQIQGRIATATNSDRIFAHLYGLVMPNTILGYFLVSFIDFRFFPNLRRCNVIGDVKRTQTEVAVNHKWTSFSQGLLYILTTTTTRMMTIHIFNADAHSGCLSQKMIT